jgi:hypothetical protein
MKFTIFRSIFTIILLLSTAHLASQENVKHADKSKTFVDSVWLWEVKTKRSVIYIAGETHDHKLLPSELLSHELANAAYAPAATVFFEGVSTKRLNDALLSERVSPPTWGRLDAAIRKSVMEKEHLARSLGKTAPSVVATDVINFINRWPDFILAYDLYNLLLPISRDANQYRNEVGFLRWTETQYKNSAGYLKRSVLETPNNAAMKWSVNCGEPSDTQFLIDRILKSTVADAAETQELEQKIHLEFKDINGTSDALALLYEAHPLWEIVDKCNIKPRNVEWMQLIKPAIEKSDKPIMVVAGIGHIIGNSGLLALLCSDGYCSSRRIANAKEIQAAK